MRLQLQVGAENKGLEPAEVSEPFMEAAARFAAASDAGGLFPGGGYTATLTVDAAGNSSFRSSSTGGLDLRAKAIVAVLTERGRARLETEGRRRYVAVHPALLEEE